MDSDSIIQLTILVILLFLSAFFSSAETALTTVNKIKMRTLSEDGNKRAETVLKVTSDSSKMLSAILIGNNIVNLSASSLATSLAIRLLGSFGAGIATGILTFLILIFGEITPKNYATVHSTEFSLAIVPLIEFLMVIFTPIIALVNFLAWGLLHLLGIKKSDLDVSMTEDELRTIVNVSHENGVIEEDEKDYIHNLFDFSDAMAKEVMIPRIDMTMVSIDMTKDELMEVFKERMFTRIPVYSGDPNHIVGIINMKDLLLFDDANTFNIKDFLRNAYFTYEQKNTSDLFDEMRLNSIPMAIVLNEYGEVAGLITLEDLLEELVGEIRDEYDSDEEDDIVKINDLEYDVLGRANLEDLCNELPLDFESEDYDTLGGYLTGLFDHFPRVGETYVTGESIILRVTKVGRRRVEKVHIRFPEGYITAPLPSEEQQQQS